MRGLPRGVCFPVNILYKSIAGRYRPGRVADGQITARCRFIKNASWVAACVPPTKLISGGRSPEFVAPYWRPVDWNQYIDLYNDCIKMYQLYL